MWHVVTVVPCWTVAMLCIRSSQHHAALQGLVKRFISEKEVTSTLAMDALFCGCKAIEEASRQQGLAHKVCLTLAIVQKVPSLLSSACRQQGLATRCASHHSLWKRSKLYCSFLWTCVRHIHLGMPAHYEKPGLVAPCAPIWLVSA